MTTMMIHEAKFPATQAFLDLTTRKQAEDSEKHHRLQSTCTSSTLPRRGMDMSTMFDHLVDDRSSSDHDRLFHHHQQQVNGSKNSSLPNLTMPLTTCHTRNHNHLRRTDCNIIESNLFPRIEWSSSSNESIDVIASPPSYSQQSSTKLTSTKLSSSPTTFWGDGSGCSGGKLLTLASWKNVNKRKRNKSGLVRSQKIFCLTEIGEEAKVVSSDEEEEKEDSCTSFYYPSKRPKRTVAIGTTTPIVPLSKPSSSSFTNKTTTTQSMQQSICKGGFDDCPFPTCPPSPVYNNTSHTSSSS